MHTLENDKSGTNSKTLEKARAEIRDRLTTLAPLFVKNKYMLGEEFSMLDVAIAPLLWRLDHYGIDLGKARPLLQPRLRRLRRAGPGREAVPTPEIAGAGH